VQVSTSFSDLQEFGSKIIGPHIATERPSAPVRPYAPGMRKNPIFQRAATNTAYDPTQLKAHIARFLHDHKDAAGGR
jgi:hypothetical protein